MSLQDIKQVLYKIISLNKNLDENRLNTLLEASGWEKQNKEEALSIFKIEKKKMNNLTQETPKEISTEVLKQEMTVENNPPSQVRPSVTSPSSLASYGATRENVINFIPANLPIKEEDRQEIFLANNKTVDISSKEEISESENTISEKNKIDTSSQVSPSEAKQKINWIPILAILLIIFLLISGYMHSHGIL